MGKVTYEGSYKDSDPIYNEGFSVNIAPISGKGSQKESKIQTGNEPSNEPNQASSSQNDKLELQRKQMREASRRGVEKRKGLSQEELDRLASHNL